MGSLRTTRALVALLLLALAPVTFAQEETAEALSSPIPDFDAAIATRALRTAVPSMRVSYERRLRENPAFAGRVVVEFALSDGLEIRDVTVTQNTTGDEAFGKEIASTLLAIDWPTERVGGRVRFSYPFVFAPESRL